MKKYAVSSGAFYEANADVDDSRFDG